MPYFIFKFKKEDDEIISLENIESQDNFKEAKTKVRILRAALPEGSDIVIKMVFADEWEQAESRLRQKRTPPILREWEK